MRSLSMLADGAWKHVLLFAVIAGSLAALMLLPPIVQEPAYHHFADQRAIFMVVRLYGQFSPHPIAETVL